VRSGRDNTAPFNLPAVSDLYLAQAREAADVR